MQSAWGSLPCPVKPHCHPYHSHTHMQLLLVCMSGHRGAKLTCTLPTLCVIILTHPLSWSGGQDFFGSPCVPSVGVVAALGQLDSSSARCGDWKGVQVRESWVGMAAHIGDMKGASCLYGGTSWGWCWEMGSGPVLMGVVPFLRPASFAMGQGACTQSSPPVCPLPNEEGDEYPSAGCCIIRGHLMFSAALPCSQWVG